jgi:hypothetical protein
VQNGLQNEWTLVNIFICVCSVCFHAVKGIQSMRAYLDTI